MGKIDVKAAVKKFMDLFAAGRTDEALEPIAEVLQQYMNVDKEQTMGISTLELIAYSAYLEMKSKNITAQVERIIADKEDLQEVAYLEGILGLFREVAGNIRVVCFDVPREE